MAFLRMFFLVLLSFPLIHCGGGDDDKSGPEGDADADGDSDADADGEHHYILDIVSPLPGAVVYQGDSVELEARGFDDIQKEEVAVSDVVWASGAWSYSGATGTVTDIPLGVHDIAVTGKVDGRDREASVHITVNDPVTDYAGGFVSHLYVNYMGFEWTGDCTGSNTFHINRGELAGNGTCRVPDLDDPAPFTLEGERSGSSVNGNVVMTFNGSDFETPFTGTVNGDNSIDATFSGHFDFPSDDTVVDVNGVFDGTPTGR